MIVYYIGLVIFAALVLVPSYFPKKEEENASAAAFVTAAGMYLWLGGWIFGWRLGLANIPIFFLVANLVSQPLDWLEHWFFPKAECRMPMNRETHIKMRRIAQKLGLNRRNVRMFATRNRYQDDSD